MPPSPTTFTTTLPGSSADVEITTVPDHFLWILTDDDGRGETYTATPIEEYDSEEATDALDEPADESRRRTDLPDLVTALDWAVSNFPDYSSTAFVREEDDGSFTVVV